LSSVHCDSFQHLKLFLYGEPNPLSHLFSPIHFLFLHPSSHRTLIANANHPQIPFELSRRGSTVSSISAAVPLIAPLHFSRPLHAMQMQVSSDRATASLTAHENTPPRLASPFTFQRPVAPPTQSQMQTQTASGYTQPIPELYESTEHTPSPDSAPATITTFATPRLAHPQPNSHQNTPPSDPWLPRGQLDSSVTYSSPEPMFGTPTPQPFHAQLPPRSQGYVFASPTPPQNHVYVQPMYVGVPAGGGWDDGYGVRVEVDEEIRRTRRHVW
jgi:hypothetical protein